MEEWLSYNFCESGCKFRDDTEVASTSESLDTAVVPEPKGETVQEQQVKGVSHIRALIKKVFST